MALPTLHLIQIFPDKPGLVSASLMGLVWVVAEGMGQGISGLLTKLFEDDAAAKALSILGMLFIVASAAAYVLPKEVRALQKQEID